jgi:hypothetical protein
MAAGFDHHDGVLKVRGGVRRKYDEKFGVNGVECTATEAQQDDPHIPEGMCRVEKATKV